MYGDSEQNERVEQIEQRFQGKLEFETEISSSFVDQIFYYLNPKHNKNETAFIYKLRK